MGRGVRPDYLCMRYAYPGGEEERCCPAFLSSFLRFSALSPHFLIHLCIPPLLPSLGTSPLLPLDAWDLAGIRHHLEIIKEWFAENKTRPRANAPEEHMHQGDNEAIPANPDGPCTRRHQYS